MLFSDITKIITTGGSITTAENGNPVDLYINGMPKRTKRYSNVRLEILYETIPLKHSTGTETDSSLGCLAHQNVKEVTL